MSEYLNSDNGNEIQNIFSSESISQMWTRVLKKKNRNNNWGLWTLLNTFPSLDSFTANQIFLQINMLFLQIINNIYLYLKVQNHKPELILNIWNSFYY